MRAPRLLALLVLGIATSLLACRQPPERNPPPALGEPVTVSVLLDRGHPLDAVARLAAQRLNESRSPDERPVWLDIAPVGAKAGQVVVPVTHDAPPDTRALLLVPRRPDPPQGVRRDPDLQMPDEADAAVLAYALGVYDAVLVAGLAARARPDSTPDALLAWLRSQPGWRLSLGEVSYAGPLDPPLGPNAILREPSR